MICSTAHTRLEVVERLVAALQSFRLLAISADSGVKRRSSKSTATEDWVDYALTACSHVAEQSFFLSYNADKLLRMPHTCVTVDLADEEMRAAPMPDVCEVSQQLCAIARLLEVNTGCEHAAPLLSTVNKRLPVMLQALPESFFAPLLPQGSLSADQVHMCPFNIFLLTTPLCWVPL